MGRFGLIGDPIATSKSPLLFEAAYKEQEQPDGSPYKYDLIEGADFEASFKKFEEEYSAINVTAPFKELAYAKVEELADRAGCQDRSHQPSREDLRGHRCPQL